MKIDYHLKDIACITGEILKHVNSKTLLFYGDMGVGKTTLIKALLSELGCGDEVSSPTFSIVNEYESRQGVIYHFDLYRINTLEEALNFGIEDYLFSGNWCFIEWPEIIEELILDDEKSIIKIERNEDNSRTIFIN